MIDCPIRKSCQKFVHSFVNNECHEKYDTIDDGKSDRDCKSRLVFIQLKISTCPRNVHEQKVSMKEGFVCHVNSYFCFPKIELKLRSFGFLLVDNLSFSKYFNDHFGMEHFSNSHWILYHRNISAHALFDTADVPADGLNNIGTFRHGEFSTLGIFGT